MSLRVRFSDVKKKYSSYSDKTISFFACRKIFFPWPKNFFVAVRKKESDGTNYRSHWFLVARKQNSCDKKNVLSTILIEPFLASGIISVGVLDVVPTTCKKLMYKLKYVINKNKNLYLKFRYWRLWTASSSTPSFLIGIFNKQRWWSIQPHFWVTQLKGDPEHRLYLMVAELIAIIIHKIANFGNFDTRTSLVSQCKLLAAFVKSAAEGPGLYL